MKTFAYAAAAAVACLATQTAAYDETTVCPSSETAKLLALAADPYLSSCQTASGYTFVPPSAYPTEAQVLLMCLTSDCYSLISDLLALDPSDCVIDFGTVKINVLELADSFLPNCTALGFSA
ncbi:elicitin [Phytophthora sojae]|uniref:Elicitin n=2 Tax=Phytophthora sojae TaxID=67593 RepID=G4YL79_PHYSP|nr:elicitin [Phytophthora sojae]ABB56030.1 elicitin-like protein SOL7 [Phytophthora sojae]EGZ29994.1 elicitin [Phytophthora sojae]|eukprot:XP_009517269.1 elicitin [Phytophthora sojae]